MVLRMRLHRHGPAHKRMAIVERGGESREPVTVGDNIRIGADQHLASCCRKAQVACRMRQQPVRTLDERHLRKPSDHSGRLGLIRAVDHDDLVRAARLRSNRLEAAAESLVRVVCRKYDGDRAHSGHTLDRLSSYSSNSSLAPPAPNA